MKEIIILIVILILSLAGTSCKKDHLIEINREISKADSVYAAKFINDKLKD